MNIKRIIASFLAVACLSFVACSDDSASGEKETEAPSFGAAASETEKKDESAADKTFPDLQGLVDSVKEFYSEDVEFIFTEDEYSDEVLMFTYGLMDDKYTCAVDSYVLTECDGMVADTFAVINFKEGTDKTLIDEAAEALKTEYVEALKSRLVAYAPEETAAVEKYELKIYDDAIMLVITLENNDAILSATGK